jgi:CPA1 family monovalent cation:H+ antiporter
VTVFEIAAVLLLIAALCGYANYRLLKLPATTGTLAIALVSSSAIVALDLLAPGLGARALVTSFLSRIDFNDTLMRGMLSFLLFAGALHVNLEALWRNKWSIAALATIGVAVSAVVIGTLMHLVFWLTGFDLPLVQCFIFGALISPTDPIAVIGLLRDMRAPQDLETQIAGESLFNDGIGVVLFVALTSVAGLTHGADALVPTLDGIAWFAAREVIGGVLVGVATGYAAYAALKRIDEYPLELLITLALVTCAYTLSFRLHVSGPIAVVVAGLLIGNPGRQFAMSARTREHVDAFWQMVDEILNAVLFLLIGLELFALSIRASLIAAAALAIVVVVLARWISVALPVLVLSLRRPMPRGVIPILTWSGLRGGLSVAMVLSLPPLPGRDALLMCTYAVVIFTVLVQGLTVRAMLTRYGFTGPSLDR